ncbi:MAG: sigma-70 family RNA polymerase sigma factor [Acidobacteria bacterium]|jgi:RNA polymerase sigma-70 factor (ECF subfamily)|nr:sigma-70 family RNA polymerase sigma factor [Acidobacteriota bacterium]
MAGPDDAELLRRTAAGDRAAFDEVVARHKDAVWRLCRAAAPTRQDAEDALQEAFLSAFRHAGQFRGESSVRTWLLTIARHAALRLSVRAAAAPDPEPDIWALGIDAGWGAPEDPEALAIAAQRRDALQRALDALEPADREVIVLRDLEQLDGESAAAVLGLALPAMKSRLHRARLRLAAVLIREGAR